MSNAVRRFTRSICTGARAIGKQIFLLGAAAAMAQAQAPQLPKPTGNRVLLVIWDGMRPDFIREDTTPNAWKLVQRGTFFANNHATYISTTEVNGSTISTGMKPYHHGIFANAEYRPEIDLIDKISTQSEWEMRVGDAMTDYGWLKAPTIAEQVRRAGLTAVVAGTKDVALLHDRQYARDGLPPHLYQGRTHPRSYLEVLTKALGKWPGMSKDNGAWVELNWPPSPDDKDEEKEKVSTDGTDKDDKDDDD